ncbi:hypothetical protein [Cupriavidus gilardii]|uniref:hypothetical protein n=1 Tax=Cupriavidus gilardii TaxID=82541 RepID=UPI0015723FD5|nr:hypothetical protein [Cupriavidus gilardii]NSX02897.1 hypothetical protein [Cupriavidus gilardii]
MAGTPSVLSSVVVDTRPPPEGGAVYRANRVTIAVQAGGRSARVQCHDPRSTPLSPRPSRDGITGAWGAVVSFFSRRHRPAALKRCASSELRTGAEKRRPDGDTCLMARDNSTLVVAKFAPPLSLLDLPPELLCEVLARVPAGDRYFLFNGSPLSATCTSFHRAFNTISAMPQYREEDAIARRIAGMRGSDQVLSTTDALAMLRPPIREWAIKAIISMLRAMTADGRQSLVVDALARARQHSVSWALELMRSFARWIPHTDTASLDMLTESALQLVPSNDESRFARSRVLAQLAQRIDPDDLPGSVRRWQTIYQAMPADACDEDYVALRALRQGLSHLCNDLHAAFTIGEPTDLLISLLFRLSKTSGPGSDPYMTACSDEELDYLPPPPPIDGMPGDEARRALRGVTAKVVPSADRLPAHII